MKEEQETGFEHDLGLGKREGHADEAGQPLAQRVVPPLDMGGFSGLFAHGSMLLLRDDRSIHSQKVCEAMSLLREGWDRLPQALTGGTASVAYGISDHLTRLTTQSDPNPGVVRFFEHKRPEFVQFQDRGSGILWIRGYQGCTEGRKLSDFFLIQLDTVVREMPKVRVRPRKLLRSW
jgi:hypothetical protein